MKKSDLPKPGRRDFLTKVVPACAATCLGASHLLAGTSAIAESVVQQEEHKFDRPYDELSYRQYFRRIANAELWITLQLARDTDEEKTVEFLKTVAYRRSKMDGERYKERKGTNDFETFKTRFIGPRSYSERLIEATVVENTSSAFEIKVSECVIAESFLRSKGGKYGHALHCYGDHCWQDGYNPKIRLIRDKTLMQGHDYCNHRYVLTE